MKHINNSISSLLIPLIFSILLLVSCQNFDFTPISNWQQLNDFPGLARASATAFVYQDKAFISLGRSGLKSGFLKDLWVYDSQTDQWTRKSDFPGEPRVKAIGAVIGEKAYVGLGGGITYADPYKDFYEYDLLNDTWKQLASFPGEASSDLFCAVIGNCIYTTLGYSNTYNSDTYKYDPQTNTWTKLKNCPVERSGTAGFAIGKDLYVGTGYANYKDFYRYHTENDSWSRMADLPKGRVLSKGLSINGQGYIMLGRFWGGSLNNGKLLSDVVKYDPATDEWTRCGDFPGGARQNMAVFAVNGKGYLVGGEDDYVRKPDVWMFQP